MDKPPQRYWFPAKRYGWGWGPPRTWQGWLVMAIWIVLFVVEIARLARPPHPLKQALFAGVMILLLLLICWWKGEPPRWRWGD